MRDSDWSRRNLLRSDWLLPIVAILTTYVLVRHTQQNVNNEIVSENKRKIKQKKTFSVEFTGVFRQKKPRSQIVPKLKKKLITFQFFCNFRDTLLSS